MHEPATPSGPAPTEPVQRWGLGDVVLGFLLAQLAATVTAGLALASSGADELVDLSMAWFALAQTGLWAGMLGVAWWASTTKGRGPESDFRLTLTLRDAVSGAVSGAVLQLVMVPVVSAVWVTLIGRDIDDVRERADDLADNASGLIGAVLLILLVGLVAPVVEEIFWRGLLLGALDKRGLSAMTSVWLSALCFGVAHLSLVELPALVCFGAAAAHLRHRSASLGPAVAAHVAFNLVTVTALLVS